MFINILALSLSSTFLKCNFYRTIHHKQNYYDVLKLNKNCTKKDIKKAYIDLTKLYHPDRNSKMNPKFFLEVSEAYKVLSKPKSRMEYDFKLSQEKRYRQRGARRRSTYSSAYYYRARGSHHSFYYNNHPPTYDMRSHVVPNSMILFACFVFVSVSIYIQILTIKHTMKFRRDEMQAQTALIQKNIQNLDLAPETKTNQQQVAILEEKFRLNGASMD